MREINPAYLPYMGSSARYRIVYGGAGSGKSVAVGQYHADLAASLASARVLVLRKVARTCRHSTFALLRQLAAYTGEGYEVNRAEMTIRFARGGEIIHAGLDDVEKLKSISGITHIWVEEATELDFPLGNNAEPDLAQVDLRLRGVGQELRPSITLTFNPTQQAAKLFDYVGVSTVQLPTRSHQHYDEGRVYVQHSTYLDNPFVGEDYTAVFRRLGGVMQAVYERGELVAVDAPDQLIPYAWVKRLFETDASAAQHDGRARMAVDVARYGDDETVILASRGFFVEYVEIAKGQDTTTTGARAATVAEERSVSAEMIAVDTVGLGSGTADTMRAQGYDVTEIIAGASQRDYVEGLTDQWPSFNNLRSQMWWHLRCKLEEGVVGVAKSLPDSVRRKLQEDLLAPRYRIGQERRIEVEPKEGTSKAWGIKRRLGRSPDVGDALVMLLFVGHLGMQDQFFIV